METLVHTVHQVNTVALRTYLTWNGRHVTKNEFSQLPQTVLLTDEDVYLGKSSYPKSDITDKNLYLVFEREGHLMIAPMRHRPVRHDYRDDKYWDKLIPSIWPSKQVHQHQFHLWNKVLEKELPLLYLATRLTGL